MNIKAGADFNEGRRCFSFTQMSSLTCIVATSQLWAFGLRVGVGFRLGADYSALAPVAEESRGNDLFMDDRQLWMHFGVRSAPKNILIIQTIFVCVLLLSSHPIPVHARSCVPCRLPLFTWPKHTYEYFVVQISAHLQFSPKPPELCIRCPPLFWSPVPGSHSVMGYKFNRHLTWST